MVRSTEQLRPRRRRSGGFFSAVTGFVLALALAASAAAQQPTTPPDTSKGRILRPVPRDTMPVRPPNMHPPQPDTARVVPPPAPTVSTDTPVVRTDTGRVARPDTAVQDTTPPPQMPLLPNPVPAAFSTGVWVFGRADIERFAGAISLGDLLDMIPGIARWRSGYYLQPEAVSAFAQTAGRIEVFLDGFELAPIASGSPDLSRIELAEVDSIRVERRLDALHIEIRSLSPTTYRPYAFVHAGVGQPNSKLFSGVFMSPHFLFGPVAFGVERLDTDGFKRAEPANEFASWGKWSKMWGNRGGLQAEIRTNTVHRDPKNGAPSVPWMGGFGSGTWILRGRWQFLPGLVAEAYYGSASVNDRRLRPDTLGNDTLFGIPVVRVADDTAVGALPKLTPTSSHADSVAYFNSARAILADSIYDQTDHQAGARVGFLRGPFWVNAALRTHTAPNLPGTAGDASGGLLVPSIGDVQAGIHTESWKARSTTETRLRGRLGPYRGLSAFAEVTSGERGAPVFQRDTGSVELFTRRSAWRAGADLDWSWLSAGIARVSVTSDSIPGFGLPFDPTLPDHPYFMTGSMTGWESHARVRLFWKPLSAEYWYLAWTQFKLPLTAGDSIRAPVYTPDQLWRASLLFQASPLKSGHLDIYARLDAHAHGVVYDAVAPTTPVYGLCRNFSPDNPSGCQPAALTSVDFFLQIRIMDLRIFFQEQNILQPTSDMVTDFPGKYGRGISSPRILYGVRWQFFD